MPNKTIYVADKDLALYSRAQELAGGSLSKAISTALRRYVDAEEGKLLGYGEITVRVGAGPMRKRQRQRFIGVQVGQWGWSNDKKAEILTVYRTRTGKFVVHTEKTPDFQGESNETGWKKLLGMGEQTWVMNTGEATLNVYESLAGLKEGVPAALYDMVAATADAPPVEDLDL